MKRKEKLEPDLMRKLLSYIHENIKNNPTIEDLSLELGISRHYLSHSLKYVQYTPFNALLTFAKLSHAEQLLKSSCCSLLEIAQESGFQNIQTFTRNYKKMTGMSPQEFRKQQKLLLAEFPGN